ncbi:MAG: Uma2 family endonuclease, partial [Elioraea sp.]|nr:Uma2 family endonuclease [Elioraea sp.]
REGNRQGQTMSAAVESAQRHAITAEEYLRMGEAGVFGPEARLELIEGEIVEMAPIGSQRAGTVKLLNRLFSRLAGDHAILSVQDPVLANARSVPQPDLALLRPRADSYTRSHPTGPEVLLVVEVSDTTLAYDLGTKVPLYARAGIPEAWVVDLSAREVRVFRDPGPSGYRTVFTLARDGVLAAALLPAVSFPVAELFPE